MKIKLIAADLDGTLLHDDKSVSQRTLSDLQKAAEAGCIVMPATGRVLSGIPHQVLSVPGISYAITSNGASVVDLKKHSVIYSNLMTTEESGSIVKKMCKTGFLVEAYLNGTAYCERKAFERMLSLNPPKWLTDFVLKSQNFVDDLPSFISSHNAQLEKVNMPYIPEDIRVPMYKKLRSENKYFICSSCPTNIEVNTIGCSKGKALKVLCSKFGINPDQAMAIGDSGNDLKMLQEAGVAVAMKNAEPEISSAANFVTSTNNEDGVAAAIEKFVLS